MSKDNPPLMTGEITFIQNNLPLLRAGEYLITVEQSLLNKNPSEPDGKDVINETYSNTKRFWVSGERFSFDPVEFYSSFPPPNSQGEYSNVLPHIVLTRRTLPWERFLNAEIKDAPWLALLLFDDDDPPPPLQAVQGGDLQRQDFLRSKDATQPSKSTLPSTAVSYPDGFAKSGLTFVLEPGENLYDHCQAIDVPVDLFNAIIPSLDDLKYLAHARTVTMDNKEGSFKNLTSDYSVVIGNRLPELNTKCTVHLVSLEGLLAYLPSGADYSPASITLPDKSEAGLVRLVSLKSWSFTSVDPKQTFEGYLENVDSGPLQIKDTVSGSTDSEKYVVNAFNMGYTAINHQTRLGDKTASWYRGPLVPFQVPPTIFIPIPDDESNVPVQPINTADEVIRYNPETGLLDVSYGAAWQIGRLLALQDKTFSVSLFNWKRANAQKTALAVEREIIQQNLGETLSLSEDWARQQGSASLRKAAINLISTKLKPHLIPRKQDEGEA
jgi:hypothetical protein